MPIELRPVADHASVELWRQVHNRVIPTHQLTADDMRERLTRNHLTLGYEGQELVGNATVRPAYPESPPTVIVRILPAHRRRGLGSAYWRELIAHDVSLQGCNLATVVLTANEDGLRFAESLGFVETERYAVDGAEYADMERPA